MKKLIALFLVISLLVLSGNLYAKERRGAELMVDKKDGQRVRGELIAVKQDSLLLLERESWADVSVDIEDISVITIVKKSKAWIGAVIGGPCAWFIYGLLGTKDEDAWFSYTAGEIPGILALGAGALLGALMVARVRADKTIQIEGKSNSEIKEILEDLRSKARIPDYQ